MCKFIQPTKCGFNFLNLNTNKCILRKHLYIVKFLLEQVLDLFAVSGSFIDNDKYRTFNGLGEYIYSQTKS
jgi:hypothetical protein